MQTNEVLKRIANSWKLDAKTEDSNKYFYSYDEVKSLLNNEKCYVIGRKGTGKTAICEHIINMKATDSLSKKLSFKNFPFNDLYKLSNNSYTPPNQYITLWKYLIYSTVCEMMSDNNAVDSNIRKDLKQIYPNNPIQKLDKQLKTWTAASFSFNILGIGGNLELQRQIIGNTDNWIDRVSVLEKVISDYASNTKYYVVFDELDEDYREIQDTEGIQNYINLLTSLFKAVQDIKGTFKSSGLNIMPIVFLRDDIYALIHDADKNKWSDLRIELEWTKEKIKMLLAYRISKDIGDGRITYSFEEAWHKIFNMKKVSYGARQKKQTDSFTFISRNTQMRPRDFINYIKSCSDDALKNGKNLIDGKIIKRVDRAFSNYLKSETEDEIFPLLPEIDIIFQIISRIRKLIFTREEFVSEYEKSLSNGKIKESDIDKVLNTLYNFSVIGNQHRSIETVHFFKYIQTNMQYNQNENIVIHRGLLKALQLR